MGSDLREVLAAALDIEVPPEKCRVQRAYDIYKRKLCGVIVETPIKVSVRFLPENFPHLIKLQYCPDKSKAAIPAKCPIVIPSLDAEEFDDSDYSFDPRREKALLEVAELLRAPDRIHENLRHGQRGKGHIRGEHVYVRERHKDFWVAFTLYDPKLETTIVVSSFYVSGEWLNSCAKNPPVYTREKQ